ncbi:MAG TPA: HIT family protein [Mycobacterium sp.]|nr:HIT family protein [Mycobacterium sp.]
MLQTSAVFVIPTLTQRRANPGQVIVLPRAHVVGLPGAEPVLLGELFTVVARIAAVSPAAFGAVGTTTFNNNSAPDQDLEHLDVHVVPRHHGDQFVIPNPEGQTAPRHQRAEIAARLRHALSQD